MPISISPEQQFYSDFNKNVKIIVKARTSVKRIINNYLRKNDLESSKVYTKIYLLIYTSWIEANLVKLIHTPFGFNEDYKNQILKQKSIIEKWIKCVEIAFLKLNKKGSEVPNKKQKIIKLLKHYLEEPSKIRNKVAHGQWEIPLNKKNMKVNEDIKNLLDKVDIVKVDIWFMIFKELFEIVESLIDSRIKNNFKAHYDEYYKRLIKIQEIIEGRKNWSVEEKQNKLKPLKRSGCTTVMK